MQLGSEANAIPEADDVSTQAPGLTMSLALCIAHRAALGG